MYSFRFMSQIIEIEIIFERVKTSSYSLDFSDRVVLSPAALNSKNNLIT